MSLFHSLKRLCFSDLFSDSDIRVRLVKPELEGTSFVGKKATHLQPFFFLSPHPF